MLPSLPGRVNGRWGREESVQCSGRAESGGLTGLTEFTGITGNGGRKAKKAEAVQSFQCSVFGVRFSGKANWPQKGWE